MLFNVATAATAFSAAFSGPASLAPKVNLGARNTKLTIAADDAKGEFCYGLPGAIAPAGQFDPANLLEGKSKLEVYRLREAEITHGRVGMLAAAGFLVQENFHPLFSGDGGPAIQQIPALPPWIWFIMTMGVGIAEASRIQIGWANPYEKPDNVQSLKEGYYPGAHHTVQPLPMRRVQQAFQLRRTQLALEVLIVATALDGR